MSRAEAGPPSTGVPGPCSSGSTRAALSKEPQVLSASSSSLNPCVPHTWMFHFLQLRVHQPVGRSEAPHPPTAWVPPAGFPLQSPVSCWWLKPRLRQPNAAPDRAPVTPPSPGLQLQNLIPRALPLLLVWLRGKPVQGVQLAKPTRSEERFLEFHRAESALCRHKPM